MILGWESDHPSAMRDFLDRAIEHPLRTDEPFLQRPRGRDNLEHRTWIVNVSDRDVLHPRLLLLRHLVVLVWVERRIVRHREDEAVARIADDNGSLERLERRREVSQFLLHDVLYDRVDRQHHTVAIR